MVILRATRKLLARLPESSGNPPPSDTALGDWYADRLVIDRQPLLLLLSSRSLLTILTPARAVRTLPDRLADLVATRLRRLGIPQEVIDAETSAMSPVRVAKTADRSVLGVMVDFAKSIPYYLDVGGWDETTLPFLETRLAETPCYAGRRSEDVVFPDRKAPELLADRWLAG